MLAADVSAGAWIIVLSIDRHKPQFSLYGILWKLIEADSLLLDHLHHLANAKWHTA